jgi:hypothetical protein
MQSELYNPADSTELKKTFNSSVTFCESAHEVTRAEREHANQRVHELIDATKQKIRQQD